MARLYTNENFPRQVAEALRGFGHDVLTVQEAGKADQGIRDEDVLAYATEEGRALITLNRRDFIQLHIISSNHAGIIVCTQDTDTKRQAESIHRSIQPAAELAGRLIRVNRPQK